MRKINKIINIAVIFVIIGVFFVQNISYSLDTLRPSLISSKKMQKPVTLANYTIKVMGQVFEGKRNDVKDRILNMLLDKEDLSCDDTDLEVLANFLDSSECSHLDYEAKRVSQKKYGKVSAFSSVIEHKMPKLKERSMEQQILENIHTAWSGTEVC
jgi:hypothetical protein